MKREQRVIKLTREYYGCTIIRQDTRGGFSGCRTPWIAYTDKGQVSADTLAGVRELIRESKGVKREY